MSANDQPSILTVCLTGGASKPSQSEIDDLFASRTAALFSIQRCSSTSQNDAGERRICDPLMDQTLRSDVTGETGSGQSEKCPQCDDSACGMDAAGIACNSTAGTDVAGRVEGTGQATASFFHADSGKKALELLRVLRFDLLVAGDRLPDMTVSQLVRRVRAAWPWQKWALVGSQITTQDEITARTLGAMAVFDAPPDWRALAEMADGIRSRAASAAATAMSNVGAAGGNFSAFTNTSGRPGRNRKARPIRERQTAALSGTTSAKPASSGERSAG